LIHISDNDKPKEIIYNFNPLGFGKFYKFNNFMDYKNEIEKYVDIYQHTFNILPDYIDHIKKKLEYQPQRYKEPLWSLIQRKTYETFNPLLRLYDDGPAPITLVDDDDDDEDDVDSSFFATPAGPHGGSKIHHKRNPKTRRRKSRSCKKIYTKINNYIRDLEN
jgi:hypothetical protein